MVIFVFFLIFCVDLFEVCKVGICLVCNLVVFDVLVVIVFLSFFWLLELEGMVFGGFLGLGGVFIF